MCLTPARFHSHHYTALSCDVTGHLPMSSRTSSCDTSTAAVGFLQATPPILSMLAAAVQQVLCLPRRTPPAMSESSNVALKPFMSPSEIHACFRAQPILPDCKMHPRPFGEKNVKQNASLLLLVPHRSVTAQEVQSSSTWTHMGSATWVQIHRPWHLLLA